MKSSRNMLVFSTIHLSARQPQHAGRTELSDSPSSRQIVLHYFVVNVAVREACMSTASSQAVVIYII